MASFSISYWDLIKFHYYADTTEREDRGWKQAQRQGEDMVTSRIAKFIIDKKILRSYRTKGLKASQSSCDSTLLTKGLSHEHEIWTSFFGFLGNFYYFLY
jgi:hypothetical protein